MIPIGDSTKRRSTPLFTILIVLLNLGVFGYELSLSSRALDQFVQAVGTIPVEIVSGRDFAPFAPGPVYSTLFTAMFVHGGVMHLASNMLYLWIFGDNIEDALGHVRFVAFYLVAGLAGSLAHVWANPTSMIPTVGASGAIAGVLGAYLLLYPQAEVRTLLFLGPFITVTRVSAVFLIGFWFVTQLFSGIVALEVQTEQSSGVAFWAHIGGFVAGFIMAFAFRRPKAPDRLGPTW